MNKKMKSFIKIKFNLLGEHYWSRASSVSEKISFLENKHVHNFTFIVKVKVNHNDRDEEFFLMRNKLIEFINSR
ncbi:MAG: hypothetical protein LBC92_03275 [Rickettsiales bacterium]|jgi:hypothetical protein|nr:hypothetical protein [Rickettsiales bacterium]